MQRGSRRKGLKEKHEEGIEKHPRVRREGGNRKRGSERPVDSFHGQMEDPAQGKACSRAASPFSGHGAGGLGLPWMKEK